MTKKKLDTKEITIQEVLSITILLAIIFCFILVLIVVFIISFTFNIDTPNDFCIKEGYQGIEQQRLPERCWKIDNNVYITSDFWVSKAPNGQIVKGDFWDLI